MAVFPQCLTPGRVQQLLDGQLLPEEETQAIAHLDGCASCRGMMDASIGGVEWHTELRTLLSDDGTDSVHSLSRDAVDSHSQDLDGGLVPDPASVIERLNFLAPSEDPRMLGRMGVYEVMGVIGHGAMGIVLKAFDAALNRHVALKVLWPHLATNAAARQRFAREGRAAAAVVHEHVVPIYAVDEFRGLPYIVLRYVPGRSLQERIARQGRLQVDEILRIGRQIAAGLDAAHAQGLIHRDIKPANILLEHGIERVLVTDFGLARAADDASLTHSGMIAGTPMFMAPEQARGDAMDCRSDLFSLGSVIYMMCAGQPPFRAETMIGVLNRICNSEPRRLRELNSDVPEWLECLVQRLMAKSSEQRFQSAAEVAQILNEELAHRQCPTSIAQPCRKWLRHKWNWRVAATWLSVSIIIIAVFAGVTALNWRLGIRDTIGLDKQENRVEQPSPRSEFWLGPVSTAELLDLHNELHYEADRWERALMTAPYRGRSKETEWQAFQAQVLEFEAKLRMDLHE